MRLSVLLSLAAVFLTTTPVFAGTVSYTNGSGSWVSTSCQAPQSPATFAHDPEAAADDLNARLAAHNLYVIEVENYMNCIRDEAQKDGEAIAQTISRSAGAEIQRAHASTTSSATALEKERVKVLNNN